MKETRYFYVPDAAHCSELPEDEAQHALRVLRLTEGDEIVLMDGEGTFYEAVISHADRRVCCYQIQQSLPQQRPWRHPIHLAIAPTKMMERMEWLYEKATEIGVDELSLLSCQFSERRTVKEQRLEKIVVAAMKQSRKAWKPIVNPMQDFRSFLSAHTEGLRFIAHCYEEVPRADLFSLLQKAAEDEPVVVLVGPEGDFSIDEVREAVSQGFISVSLGSSRLRTETAGLVSVMMMQLSQPPLHKYR